MKTLFVWGILYLVEIILSLIFNHTVLPVLVIGFFISIFNMYIAGILS